VTFKGTSYQEFEDEYSGAVKIPETANYSSVSYKVTSIGNSAFEHCGGLTSVEMPHSVLTLGYNVFSGCSNLSSVEMSNSITSIGGGAFTDCSKLSSVTLPNTLTSIGAASFSGSGLTSFTIPASVQSIGINPLSNCANLTSIVVEESNPYFHSQSLAITNLICASIDLLFTKNFDLSLTINVFYFRVIILISMNLFRSFNKFFSPNKFLLSN
jgi:hypothetical protein